MLNNQKYKKSWNNRGGGVEGQFKREITYLKQVYKEPHFPILLSINLEKFEIYINYCGKKINKNNVPFNWKKQIEEIVSTLDKKKIIHNDMHIGNFLVKDNIIYLIDFGWASDNKFWPYCNISLENINEHSEFIKLLDTICKHGVKDRINFVKSYKN